MVLLIYYFSDAEFPNFKIAYWIGGIGITLGVLCMLSHKAYGLIFILWKKFAHFIDLVITWSTLLFIVLLTLFQLFFAFLVKLLWKQKNSQNTTFWKTIKPPHLLNNIFANFNYA